MITILRKSIKKQREENMLSKKPVIYTNNKRYYEGDTLISIYDNKLATIEYSEKYAEYVIRTKDNEVFDLESIYAFKLY